MKENGKGIKQMDSVNFGMLMVTISTGTGKKTRQMVSECTFIRTEHATKANGRTTFSTDKELRPGKIIASI